MLKARIESSVPNRIAYCLDNADLHLLVALRRTMITSSQSFAFEPALIDISINKTVLQTVVLQDAISQLPIRATETLLHSISTTRCGCSPQKWCQHCGLVFELGVINDTDSVKLVTTDFFNKITTTTNPIPQVMPCQKWTEIMTKLQQDETDHDIFLLPGITIVKLNPDQSVQIRAVAKVGHGSMNARYNPVAVIGLEPAWKVEIEPHEPSEELRIIADSCPQKVFGMQDGKLVLVNERACTNCRDCRIEAEKMHRPNLIHVTAPIGKHRMCVETVGTRDATSVMKQSCSLLVEKLQRIRASLQTLQIDRVEHPEARAWLA